MSNQDSGRICVAFCKRLQKVWLGSDCPEPTILPTRDIPPEFMSIKDDFPPITLSMSLTSLD